MPRLARGRGDRRATIRENVHREMHGAVVRATGTKTAARCTWPLNDIRRGRRTPWLGMLQTIDHLVDVGADAQSVLAVPAVIEAYAIERLAERGPRDDHTPTAPARKAA